MTIKGFCYLATAASLISGCILTYAQSPGKNWDGPFIVEASQDVSSRFPGAPRLQSFAWAHWRGKWIFFAGRATGYQGGGGGEADFARAGANDRIYVVDPTGSGPARTFSYPLSALPDSLAAVKDQWMSTNPPFVQDGDTLYVAGGYGQDSMGAW